MYDDGISNEFEEAHQKGLNRGFDLGWSYKGRFDRQIIEDEINALQKQCDKVSDPKAKLRLLSQKQCLGNVLSQIKNHPCNRENITFNSW